MYISLIPRPDVHDRGGSGYKTMHVHVDTCTQCSCVHACTSVLVKLILRLYCLYLSLQRKHRASAEIEDVIMCGTYECMHAHVCNHV